LEKIIKRMKKILLTIMLLAMCAVVFGRTVQTVTFDTKLHCKQCVKKVVENVSFIKGVKDLEVSLEKQQIKVVFDPAKTSVEALSKEIKSLGYPVSVASSSEPAAPKQEK